MELISGAALGAGKPPSSSGIKSLSLETRGSLDPGIGEAEFLLPGNCCQESGRRKIIRPVIGCFLPAPMQW